MLYYLSLSKDLCYANAYHNIGRVKKYEKNNPFLSEGIYVFRIIYIIYQHHKSASNNATITFLEILYLYNTVNLVNIKKDYV